MQRAVHAFAMRDGEKELLTRYLEGRYIQDGLPNYAMSKLPTMPKTAVTAATGTAAMPVRRCQIHSAVGAAATDAC